MCRKFEDNFNSAPLTQIVYLSRTKCTPKFKQDLFAVGKGLGIPVEILDSDGVLNSVYQKAFQSFFNAQNTENATESKTDDVTSDEDADNPNKDSDNDECVTWLKSVIANRTVTDKKTDYLKGLRKKGPRARNILPSEPRLGGIRKSRDFFKLNDSPVRGQKSLLLRTNEQSTKGGALTRSSRKRLLEAEEKDDSRREKNPQLPQFLEGESKPRKKRRQKKDGIEGIAQDPQENNDRVMDKKLEKEGEEEEKEEEEEETEEEEEEEEKKEKKKEEGGTFNLKRGGIIIVDDAFVSNEKDNTQNANSKSDSLYRTIKHLNLIAEASSHHFGISLLIISQSPQIATGSSVLANYVRRIKQNLDVFILFKMDSSTVRHFLNGVATGEQYQNLKSMYSFATNPPSNYTIDSQDQRGCYPCFIFTLSNQSCSPHLKYR